MVLTKRAEYELASNWKLIIDHAFEDYHTLYVHRNSLGEQHARAVETEGNWELFHLPSEGTVAVLPEDNSPFEFVDGLVPELAAGGNFTLLYPNTQFACMQDSMWWLNLVPLGPGRCLNRVGFCFPRKTVERRDFEDVAQTYYRRWDISIDEDNGTGELQHVGMTSHLREPGPYSHREKLVHRYANWILDRVLDAPAATRAAAE
jgi:choline monooxygenase